MANRAIVTQDVLRAVEDASPRHVAWDRVWMYRDHTLVFDFSVYGHAFALDLTISEKGVEYWALARSEEGRRILRMALIGRYRMVKNGGERHLLGHRLPEESVDIDDVKSDSLHYVDMLVNDLRAILQGTSKGSPVSEELLNILWWDKRPNFGDAIGPWIASKITGKRPVNGWGRWLDPAPLATVGSILDVLEQDGTRVWGTGLMNPLTKVGVERLGSLRGVSVHAVRGRLTAGELRVKLGWEVPEVYGDPALLLPRFLSAETGLDTAKKIAVVPHYFHAAYFQGLKSADLLYVDVEQGLERVIQDIGNAELCISTSLHGVIIAQAYGVPWVWLRIEDHPLGGDTFKFQDFLSTLSLEKVPAAVATKKEITVEFLQKVASQAALPGIGVSLDALHSSFPLSPSEGAHDDSHRLSLVH